MSGFLDIVTVEVPQAVVDQANEHLREVGKYGWEGFSLWAGKRDGQLFRVTENIVPLQTGHRSPDGVCVSVGPEELHRINVWLYQNGLTLMAQLHSHPTEAYHSDTDDAYPISTTVGSFSIVIPYFARAPFSFRNCAVYRLSLEGKWAFVEPREVATIFSITK